MVGFLAIVVAMQGNGVAVFMQVLTFDIEPKIGFEDNVNVADIV